MKTYREITFVLLVAFFAIPFSSAVGNGLSESPDKEGKILRLWYDEPAPDSDAGWADRSIPMGNGYMGINLFGGTTTERIQITENSLYSSEAGGGFRHGGLNNFAEVFLDFGHNNTSNYERDLNLNKGVAHVNYEQDGVAYLREYFTSYPDKVMVIRLSASEAGKLSFTLRPTIPYLDSARSGSVVANGDLIILSGVMHHYKVKYEGQFKVIPEGGTMKAGKNGTITVSDADQAVILIAVGTNYQIDPHVFLTDEAAEKLADFPDPHARVSGFIADAAAKSYEELLAGHLADYTGLFDRVNFDLGAAEPDIPTDELVDAYPEGKSSRYMEELAFQFGRYMLICSSRAGTLPPHLQGIWNVYKEPPWASQYLHDTNLQMAYSPVFSTNLSELFKSYMEYFKAFVPRQYLYATQYVEEFNPSNLDPKGDNGWSGPFWSNPYRVPGRSIVATFGTGSWIALMFWDYYDYTRDESLLADEVYPILYDQANFVSRFVKNTNGVLLADPSSSPEQKIRDTVGTTFDQQMFYENHHNTLKAARILGRSDSRLATFTTQLPLLDPIQVGKSGHIKEFRQEEFYGEMGDPSHRHSSMLLGLFPGQLINDLTPAWLDAAKVSLTGRSHKSRIGWARAERIGMWARAHNGEEAYSYYRELLGGNYMHNLFNDHRGGHLFQADANYGATGAVAEMLLQSQDYVVSPLSAMPAAWSEGSYRGLMARGNFQVSAHWTNGHADQLKVLSRSGGILELSYPNVARAVIKTAEDQSVDFVAKGSDQVSIQTNRGQTYVVTHIPVCTPVTAPSNLKIDKEDSGDQIQLSWTGSADALSYKLYRAVGNAPDYELVASKVKETRFVYEAPDLKQIDQMTFKVTAVGADGRESDEGAIVIRLLPANSCSSSSALLEGEKNRDGSFKKWHRLELVFNGPHVNESSNTFRNYRLDVTFTSPSGKEFKVPGFFDADGNPANTSSTRGNKWKVRFAGGEEGVWSYHTSFVSGENVAANLSGGTGGTAPDGETGTFHIGPQDKSNKDFRAKGKLEYVGEHYLRFADGDYFIKLGPNSPEVFLEYGEFDGTPAHENDLYTPHISEWKTGNPTWGDGKGKGIIGLVNYLSSFGLNVHYFLCMNAYGDGMEAWPWIAQDSIYIYDVSKLAQWEVLFTHFDKMGMMVHFQLSESENTNYLEDREGKGTFSDARKILYRELVARFGHHMAITWNIGEENQAKGTGFQIPNSHSQRKEFASRIRALTYYNDHISVHNGPAARFDDIFPQLIGHKDITGPSLQTYLINPKFLSNHVEVRKWYDLSANNGHKWVVSVDEPWWGKRPEYLVETLRKEVVWGALLAGGHMEFYAGRDDVRHIDYTKYEECWKVMGRAAIFMNENLAKEIVHMKPNDDLAMGKENWAMADEGQTYLLYLKNGGEARVDLSRAKVQEFTVQWFNPRDGGDLIEGTPGTIIGGSENVSLGSPPNTSAQDWVVLLKNH